MDRTDFASRKRTIDVPDKPESGLAEWTSKIKAMQRQVDEDEEAETKRLQDEIAASRLARMRRSTGRGTSTDLSKSDVAAALKESDAREPDIDGPRSTADRQRNHDDTLTKLAGPGGHTRAEADYNSYVASKTALAGAGAPMSLAAFMGGKATGPRLNRHAPQQDAHDPTQFDQRPITGPHPIFGRGGIAMPGMVGKARPGSERKEEPSIARPASRTPDRDVLTDVPSFQSSRVRSIVSKVDSPVVSQTLPSAARTEPPRQSVSVASTPAFTSSRATYQPAQQIKSEPPSARPSSYSPAPVKPISRPTTPKERASPSPNVFSRPAPLSSTQSPSFRSPSPPKSPSLGSTPGLAKPIQPSPRKSFQGPQISLSSESSSSYLRPPPAKDPTPSISRLQGRGFVQSMVRASGRSETSPAPGSPSDRGKGRGSVLDRWQHGGESPPVIAPKPIPLRKSRTEDPSMPSYGSSTPVAVFPMSTPPPPKSEHSTPSLKSRASFHSLNSSPSQRNDTSDVSGTPSQKRNLGSSTTMVSYIKPLKTGDGPASPPPRPSSASSRGRPTTPGVDELGVRVRSRTRSFGATSREREEKRTGASSAGASGKPLSHPTKSRPHKPKKARVSSMSADSPVDSFTADGGVEHSAVSPVASPQTYVPAETRRQSDPPKSLNVKDEGRSARSDSPPTPGASRGVHFPLDVPAPQPEPQSPTSPGKHSRIPSTGNRATVMEVVQTFTEHERHPSAPAADATMPVSFDEAWASASPDADEAPAKVDVRSMVAGWGVQDSGASHSPSEKRKSSFEAKYSAFTLPPLLEEKTPVASPVGTLSRSAVPPTIDAVINDTNRQEMPALEAKPVSPIVPSATLNQEADPEPVKQSTVPEVIYVEPDESPLPPVDVEALLRHDHSYKPDPDVNPISAEVLSIVGAVATPVNHDAHTFYDSEVLAIVYRSKAKSSGLVSTKVWAWYGAKSQAGDKEERKLQELARRYNTSLVVVKQYAEPAELVSVLGGKIVTRQGTRAHWTAENTAMYLIRSVDDLVYIDELELNITNLCSGFSYCLSLLETVYVWNGRGSSTKERLAALEYAKSLSSNVIELSEEAGDEEEMFWIILGEGEYGKADYWRWKAVQPWTPRLWLIDSGVHYNVVQPIASFTTVDELHTHVYIVDCVWEYFVLVGSQARGQRRDIRLALTLATEMAAKLAPTRPYTPTVHVLVLPSRLPIDLRLAFRDINEIDLNQGTIPDHMNVLAVSEAFEHLGKTTWERSSLADPTMLPLGFSSSL